MKAASRKSRGRKGKRQSAKSIAKKNNIRNLQNYAEPALKNRGLKDPNFKNPKTKKVRSSGRRTAVRNGDASRRLEYSTELAKESRIFLAEKR